MVLPSLVVFGPQTTNWPPSEYLSQIRASLQNEPRLSTFIEAIKQLPDLWTILVEYHPSLCAVPGAQAIQSIQQWISSGELSWWPGSLPNVLFTPLTVIIQLVQYFCYLENDENHGVTHALVLESAKSGGVQGFCTGFLTAIAVACSANEEDVNVYGAVALRLAVCISAFVDLDGTFASPPNETTCLAVRWKPEKGCKGQLFHIMKDYPDVRVPNWQIMRFVVYIQLIGTHSRPIFQSFRTRQVPQSLHLGLLQIPSCISYHLTAWPLNRLAYKVDFITLYCGML